ncbi:MAG TPA: ABC transporter ATP-binding protein [Pedococcus sp.]|nr:ABC transporter ATP-binding protein [Pedococcus sp.]
MSAAATGDLMTASNHAVEIRSAVKRFGDAIALDGVDLDIETGQFTVLLGPSGSGKSTLLRTIAGIERLDSGTVHLGGSCVSQGRHHVPPNRRDLAMVFQDYALWPHLTVLGNVGYALRRRKLDAREAARRAREALARVGLAALAERYPHELSGGEQQRVGLARAIVADPAVLLFDEPLSNLDADLRERLRVEIATVTRDTGATAVYITHDQSEAFALADRIGVLHAGQIEQYGPPEEIYHRPRTPFVAKFTGVSGTLHGRVDGRRGDYVHIRCGSHQLTCRAAGPLRPGDTVKVLIRPAATALALSDAAVIARALTGTVIDIAYRGRGYDHVVDCGNGVLTSVFDPNPWPRGRECLVTLDPDGCTAFPEHATDPGRDITAVSSTIEPQSPSKSVDSDGAPIKTTPEHTPTKTSLKESRR